MPFGAQLDGDQVCFRLWAPAAGRVDLYLIPADGAASLHAMAHQGQGWYQIQTAAKAGDCYKYIVDGLAVADPASRFQPADSAGPSEIIDPGFYRWRDHAWSGRPWHETVVYEIHAGCLSGSGGYDDIREKLDYLQRLGVTAVELMPLADFPGRYNWGYDGVLWYAPDHRYGRPEQLKALVDAAHERRIMVFLDVVYNHFGPQDNYIYHYAPAFKNRRNTPWGKAVNTRGSHANWVKQFVLHNVFYWLDEFHMDGLRLDAVQYLHRDWVHELIATVADRYRGRHVHLMLENDDNHAPLLGSVSRYVHVSQWNDDFHHAAHRMLTGEQHGFYADYPRPRRHFTMALQQGFSYQGQYSQFRRQTRGTVTGENFHPLNMVNYLQNHDQVGNRLDGRRLHKLCDPAALAAVTVIFMLSPSVPLLFMGQEYEAVEDFNFFCDLSDDFAAKASKGRVREFRRLMGLKTSEISALMANPKDPRTYRRCRLNPATITPAQKITRRFYRQLMMCRRRFLQPLLNQPFQGSGCNKHHGVNLYWDFGDSRWQLYWSGTPVTCANPGGLRETVWMQRFDPGPNKGRVPVLVQAGIGHRETGS